MREKRDFLDQVIFSLSITKESGFCLAHLKIRRGQELFVMNPIELKTEHLSRLNLVFGSGEGPSVDMSLPEL